MKTAWNKPISTGRIFIVLTMAQVLLSATYLMAKVALYEFSPMALGLYRFFAAAAILTLIARKFHPTGKVAREDRWMLLLMAVLAVPLNQSVFLYAIQFVPSAHGALLYATTPIMVLAMSTAILGERTGWLKTIGILLGFSGVILVLFNHGLSFSSVSLKGDLLLLTAVLTWALYTICNKKMVDKYPPLFLTAKALMWGSLLFLPIGLPSAFSQDYSRIGWKGIGALAYMAFLTSVLGYWAWSWGLSKLEASKVAVVSNIQPVLAAIWGWIFLGEAVTLRFVVGTAVVITGVFITEQG